MSWHKYKDQHFKYIRKVKIKVITLEKYCLDNDINSIDYLHIDTQGNDLKVLKGLKGLKGLKPGSRSRQARSRQAQSSHRWHAKKWHTNYY